MATAQEIESFLSETVLAVVGASRSPRKFGHMVYRKLKEGGYRAYPINPKAESIDGDRCFADIQDLPERVGGIVTVVPPDQTEAAVRRAAELGIRKVWMQDGSESPEAIRFCQENGITAIHGHCIMMFAEPVRHVHSLHRWVRKVLGGLPK